MEREPKVRILSIVGPTASGKSALALRLASRLGGEIVSCDSMQIYRDMDIGTAKPTREEMERIPHHLIGFVPPTTLYSCGDYVRDASTAIREISARKKLPILCGGTGLYLDCLLRGGMGETQISPEIRKNLEKEAEENGIGALYERLAKVDPESAAAIHPNNEKRVIRALEIYLGTGITKSEADKRTQTISSPYLATVIGLRAEDRDLLYRRIDERVGEMMDRGLAEETRRLRAQGVFLANRTAAQAIGYKELFDALDRKEPLSEAVEKLKLATRHYAKRQMTWFSSKSYVRWISLDRGGEMRPVEELEEEALSLFSGGATL